MTGLAPHDRRAPGLVLSCFPGIGMLDEAFTREGVTVVRGPDVIWGGDIRTFHPPAGVFDGVIGGDPCQSHSALANLVRAKGLEPSFPDVTPDFQRVIEEAQPAWFLRENTPLAPDIKPAGYDVRSFLLDNSTLDSGDGWGNEQMRRRRFWFGTRDGECPELRQWIDFALRELPDAVTTVQGGCTGGVQGEALKRRQQAVSGDTRSVPVAIGGSGKRKVTAVAGGAGGGDPENPKYRGIPNRTLEEMLRLQGFPEDWMKHQPWTMQAKRKMVGNGVALPTGRALAQAIRSWHEELAA